MYSYGETSPSLFVSLYGFETNIATAHWGPGKRTTFILHFVTKGKGFFNGQSVSAGQAFFITPYTDVEYHPDDSDPWQYFWLNFTGLSIPDLFNEIGIDYKKNQIFNYDFKDWLIDFTKDMEFYEEQNKLGLYGNAIFYSIHSLLKSDKNLGNVDKKTKHVNDAVHFIKNNFHKKLSVEDVAKALNLNRHYLSSVFKKKTGMSTYDYISNTRLTKSKELLQTTNLRISEIALAVGFDDQFHFSKFFKSSVGLSPLQYRKQTKKSP